MPAFGIRFTPQDISGYSFDWIKQQKHCIAKEIGPKTKKLHYQMYIETDYCIKTVRNNITKSLKIPIGIQGRESAYYAITPDWKDWTYTLKDAEIISQNIVDPRELPELIAKATLTYGEKEQPVKVETIIEVREKTDLTWDTLLQMYDEGANYRNIAGNKENKFATYSINDFRNWICAYYLRRRKPIPRAGDLGRYSFSLYCLKQQDVKQIKEIDMEFVEKYSALL